MTSTPQVSAIRAAIEARWGNLSDLGTFSCRRIRGQYASSSPDRPWSQHAWGNAWDVGAPAATLDAIEAWLPRSGLPYGGVLRYADHVHIEGRPKRTGTPPCAGGDAADPALWLPPLYPTPPGAPGGPGGGTLDDPMRGLRNMQTALGWLTDPDNWTRIGLGAAGAVVLVLGLVLLARDLTPAGNVAGAVAKAAT